MNMILHNITRFTIENTEMLEAPHNLDHGQIRKFSPSSILAPSDVPWSDGVFQISNDQGMLITRMELLRNRGYEVTHFIHILQKREPRTLRWTNFCFHSRALAALASNSGTGHRGVLCIQPAPISAAVIPQAEKPSDNLV
jgi:hypothetical protein